MFYRAIGDYSIEYSSVNPNVNNKSNGINLKPWVKFDGNWYLIKCMATEIIDSYNKCQSFNEMKKLTSTLIDEGKLKWE